MSNEAPCHADERRGRCIPARARDARGARGRPHALRPAAGDGAGPLRGSPAAVACVPDPDREGLDGAVVRGGRTWAAACGLAGVIVGALALGEALRSRDVDWRQALQRAETALIGGDVRGAEQAWEDAYRVAMRVRTPEAL